VLGGDTGSAELPETAGALSDLCKGVAQGKGWGPWVSLHSSQCHAPVTGKQDAGCNSREASPTFRDVKGGRTQRSPYRDLMLPPVPTRLWAWELNLALIPFCSQFSHPPTPTPTFSAEKGPDSGERGRSGKLSWWSVCFGLIPAFLLLSGLGPQIWHFLFGLGQRSAALEALALLSQFSRPLLPCLAIPSPVFPALTSWSLQPPPSS
jgi:hypothetical protein